jgi:hypothetical protein
MSPSISLPADSSQISYKPPAPSSSGLRADKIARIAAMIPRDGGGTKQCCKRRVIEAEFGGYRHRLAAASPLRRRNQDAFLHSDVSQ